MEEPILALFNSDNFMPHGHCILWSPPLLWLYIISDAIIGLAYYSIPVALIYFTRKRRDLQFNWIFILFSLFIFACGTTHFFAIWTIWNPDYWLDAMLKAVTALVSLVTAVLLWPLIPKALRLPSPEKLQAAIQKMEKEVFERTQAETRLAQFNETLELRVAERTAELEQSNQRLEAEIDARKQAEERFKLVVEHAPSGMVMTSPQGVIEMMNLQTENIFGYSREELLGKPIEMLVPQKYQENHPSLRHSFYQAPDPRAMGKGRDLFGLRKDGTEVPLEVALNPISTDSGTVVLAAIVDISDRKQREQHIQNALKEKTTLLSEVHHRVKNNLQLIHSLLDLQALQTDDPAVVEILENSKRRINSMSLIHQAFYQSNDLANIELSEVLRTLVENIATSYNPTENPIALTIDADSVCLPITKAIPCGLIVNELVTNAMKYAFPDNNAGEIKVILNLDEKGQACLSVTDNGIGLPADLEFDNLSSLGMELVSVLAEQIGGELTVQYSNPTRFEIRFTLNNT